MSISSPASSRWSRPDARPEPHERSVVSSSAADGSGGLGSAAFSAASSVSSAATSASRSRTAAATSCISAIAALASSPACFAAPIAFDASLRRACSRLELRAQRVAPRVERERPVEHLLGAVAAAGQRGPHRRGVAADRPEIEHSDYPLGGGQFGSVLFGDLGTLRLEPAYLATKFASALADGPVTMFCGIGPEEKPPLRMA